MPGACIVLIANGDEFGNLYLMSPRHEEHFRATERACMRTGIFLAIVSCDYEGRLYGPGGDRSYLKKLVSTHTILGVMIWTIGIQPASYDPLLMSLSKIRHILLLDETGALQNSSNNVRHRGIFFSIASDESAGYVTGQYIVQHRSGNVAYISPFHATQWSVDRLKSLQSGLSNATCKRCCYPLTISRQSQEDFISSEEQTIKTLIEHSKIPQIPITAYHVAELTGSEHLYSSVSALTEKALAMPKVGVLVCSADSVAVQCFNYLMHKRIPVPGKISIIGFDDSLEAFLSRITSFNFNGAAVVDSMVEYLVRIRQGTTKNIHIPEKTQGFITVRAT